MSSIGVRIAMVLGGAWLVGCSSAAPEAVDPELYSGVHGEFGCYDMPTGPRGIVVTSTTSNTWGNYTRIPNPCLSYTAIVTHSLTAPSNQTLAVTQTFNPGGVGGTYNPHHVGVWFDGTYWNVFNEDGAAMPIGASFNVVVDALTTVSSPFGKPAPIPGATSPSSILIASNVWNPPGHSGVYNNHESAVSYQAGLGWTVFDPEGASLANGASFNVSSTSSFLSFSLPSNVSNNYTYLDDSRINGNPNALILVTENLTPNGKPATAVSSPLGVWYNAYVGKWAVFNEDRAPMPYGAAFNVWVL